MRIFKMEKVVMAFAVMSFVFFAGCDDKEPDTPYGFCDFTFKGKSYHYELEYDSIDPIFFPIEYGENYSFTFASAEFARDTLWMTFDPKSVENRDLPIVGSHTIEFLDLHINGEDIGTVNNKGKITITQWDSHYGEEDAEYTRSICKGSFSGMIVEADGTETPIEGKFEGTIDDEEY